MDTEEAPFSFLFSSSYIVMIKYPVLWILHFNEFYYAEPLFESFFNHSFNYRDQLEAKDLKSFAKEEKKIVC